MRYLVIEIGCLECSDAGDCEPEVTLRTNSLDEATDAATKPRHTKEWDRFVVDTVTGATITTPH